MPNRQLLRRWDRLSRDEIRRLQGLALSHFLRRKVAPYSSYYRDRFREAGVDVARIHSLEDLSQLPFTSKADLLSSPQHPERARDFVLIPDREALKRQPSVILRGLLQGRKTVSAALASEYRPVFLTSTTGRSAQPIPFLYTHHDMDNLSTAGRRLVDVMGATPEQRLINMFPYAPHLAFWQTHYATLAFNVFTLSTGGGKVMGTAGNIRSMRSVNPDAIIGMPTFLYHVLTAAREEGIRLPKLSTLVLGGEKVPQGMRRKLKELAIALGAVSDLSVVATYGFTEAKVAWGECPHPLDGDASGYHLYPDLGLFEVIDPASGKAVGDNEPGELVYTPLHARGSVVLRYRTGDFIDGGLTYEPCPHCGRRCPRLVGQISRQSEVRELQFDKLKGTLVDFNELEHVLDDAEHVGSWQLELRKVNDDPHELDEVILHVERTAGADEAALKEALIERLVAHTELRPNAVHFHSVQEMRKRQGVGEELKERRVVDNRPRDGQPPPPRDASQREGVLRSLLRRRQRSHA
ncbi:MAG: AMP-binding protein [Verrucomicrobia bacterium]|nr:AMP-binding protein [Verrucomicrobiota bacterium]